MHFETTKDKVKQLQDSLIAVQTSRAAQADKEAARDPAGVRARGWRHRRGREELLREDQGSLRVVVGRASAAAPEPERCRAREVSAAFRRPPVTGCKMAANCSSRSRVSCM